MLLGNKTEAFFDIWSFEHLMTGIILAFILNKAFLNKRSNLILFLALSFLWEFIEYYLERGLFGIKIQNWFAGNEYWGNRLIGDNLVMLLGYIIYTRYPKSIFYAVLLSLTFLCFHLFLPSSMALQEILFK